MSEHYHNENNKSNTFTKKYFDITENYTKINNLFFDLIPFLSKLSKIYVTIMLIIYRNTIGWQKKEAKIPYMQFVKETGLSKNSIITGLDELVKNKIIIQKSYKKNGYISYSYIINIKEFPLILKRFKQKIKKSESEQSILPVDTKNDVPVVGTIKSKIVPVGGTPPLPKKNNDSINKELDRVEDHKNEILELITPSDTSQIVPVGGTLQRNIKEININKKNLKNNININLYNENLQKANNSSLSFLENENENENPEKKEKLMKNENIDNQKNNEIIIPESFSFYLKKLEKIHKNKNPEKLIFENTKQTKKLYELTKLFKDEIDFNIFIETAFNIKWYINIEQGRSCLPDLLLNCKDDLIPKAEMRKEKIENEKYHNSFLTNNYLFKKYMNPERRKKIEEEELELQRKKQKRDQEIEQGLMQQLEEEHKQDEQDEKEKISYMRECSKIENTYEDAQSYNDRTEKKRKLLQSQQDAFRKAKDFDQAKKILQANELKANTELDIDIYFYEFSQFGFGKSQFGTYRNTRSYHEKIKEEQKIKRANEIF